MMICTSLKVEVLRQVSFFLLRLQIAACKRVPKYPPPCSWTEMALSGGGIYLEARLSGFLQMNLYGGGLK